MESTRRRALALLVGAVAVAVLGIFPHVANFFFVHQFQTLALNVMVSAGLWLAVGYTGVISVGHAALMASGAYASAYLAVEQGWPFPATLLAGIGVAAVLGLLLSIPTGRLTHFYFAMVTLGLAIVTPQLLLEFEWTGGYSGIFGIPRAELFGFSLGRVPFYYLVIGLAAAVVILIRNLARSRWGRALLMVRDDEVAAAAVGIAPYATKVRAFVLSSLPAGLAGVLFGYLNQVVTPGSFTLHLALFFLLAVVVGGSGSVYGSIGGVLLLFAVPELLREYRAYTNIIFGVVLIAVLSLVPGGLTDAAHKLRQWWGRRRRTSDIMAETELVTGADRPVPEWLRPSGAGVLRATGVTKHFGGLTALDSVDLVIHPGTVVAVIGPNGSGKTTLLNIVSAFYRPDRGTVALDGRSLPSQPAGVARAGVGRTFQTPKVLGSRTVLENVMAGYAALGRAGMIESATRLGRFRSDEREANRRARELLAYVGLERRLHDRAGDLPHPHLRFLEVARALAANPDVLLLDEPAAGLSAEEVAQLNGTVRDLAARGLAVVIVEHNIGLVLDIADEVVVLDSGEKIAQGAPAAVQAMPKVARVYLGEDWTEDQESGAAPVPDVDAQPVTAPPDQPTTDATADTAEQQAR